MKLKPQFTKFKSKDAALIGIGLVVLYFSVPHVHARDLVAASNTAVTTVKRIAQALSVLGIVSGGAMMQIPGLAEFGRRTLIGGLVGSLCSFGAPAFIEFMQTVFGT